ncbi:hypothetical protein NQ318_007899 [Aromia moschata]|uniref:Uncharacterized protein n=1 Tax=Aromia moschata TaxID=1265417 RepID=A0AAV8XWT0_9CUCU|nr:hypothetical protein NQ318_007899 [Aromia moschata]
MSPKNFSVANRKSSEAPKSDMLRVAFWAETEPVNTVMDVLVAAYYLNASYYQYILYLHKYKVTKRPWRTTTLVDDHDA